MGEIIQTGHIAESLRSLAVPIDSVHLDPANARKHPDRNLDAIADSLARFGQRTPIVVRRETGTVIAGNGRVAAARKLGWPTIAAVYVDDDSVEAAAYAIADNRTADLAEWDDAVLAGLLESLRVEDALDGVGFTDEEIDALIGEIDPPAPVEQDTPPDAPETAISEEGDLWTLGPHRLIVGDSTDPNVVERLLGEDAVDLVVTDPPYGVAYQVDMTPEEAKIRNRRTDGLEVENDNLGFEGTRRLVGSAMVAAKIRPGAAFYVFAPPGDLLTAFYLGLQDAGLNARHQIVWVKDRFVFGRCDYHYRHEVVLYGWADGAGHYFVDDRTLDSVWEYPRPGASKDHPTMKPVDLVARAIRNSSKRGWLVYDPFSGSGTTLIAAEQTDRIARAVELSPRYADVIVRRWEKIAGETATRVDKNGEERPGLDG